ncbi:RagB/SusD family nutrient uptake outer membrane protein [Membranicola marinus]|uniref:RagB/SusD family nutrient uptake outer membrane protein n=1 Tax=Membranihabitans marinus TaxID=1227546 RepID=A0A953HR78_9BACT|nr:RagB/SusD family nutrient uptake outer membrane protein [Membranihabitans marinus]MBY5959423.1 RagB/SusD family nutrient uptake outer membrane protein [Membranihabitans marinus]
MKTIYSLVIVCAAIIMIGCEDFLDRPPLTNLNDETAWNTEENVRLYANKYYTSFFPGYGAGWSTSGAALMGYRFSDDVFQLGNQGNFGRQVPNSGIWSMSLVRSINIMIDRVENKMQDVLSQEAYNHWMGIGRFFRGLEYASLVRAYGDVPYYDHVVSDIDLDDLYKPRTPRDEVMDAVYDDLKFALENVRRSDGDQYVNRYVVAGFASRAALQEGSWQKYYYGNNERAKKFFELAEEAAAFLINSGKYNISSEFRALFTSDNLAGNDEVVFYRHYDPAVNVLHAIASYNNLSESVAFGPTTDLIKSFICVDGQAWQNSTLSNAEDFTLDSMLQTRDPRLEATFYDHPSIQNRASYWYINKFLPRSVAKSVEAGNAPPPEFTSNKNEIDYPVFRYSEALLNWIEAKAELETLGAGSVTQGDIDQSINSIRSRPLAPEAIELGVQKTAPMNLALLPDDPNRDPDVPALLWEIRRERRMEFAFEYGRFADLERWSKLEYMDTDKNEDLLSGGWVNFPSELPSELVPGNEGEIAVITKDHEVVIYDGSNGDQMKGFYQSTETGDRLPFLDIPNVNPYLSPVGKTQMDDYESKGYKLEQTQGWPQN